ncbi:hypothetical protein EGM51_00040 [Verrucomicrobia bacterium S94]|nr:hypothetical protein EGM51_00040 [Verrucomicrobia bacterium S94]
MPNLKNGEPISQEQLEREINNVPLINQINQITHWHNFTVKTYGAYLENLKDSMAEEHRDVKALCDDFMEQRTRNFCLIMHMSNFEEISYLICKSESVQIKQTVNSISRFSEGWKKRTGKNDLGLKAWSILTDAEKVRNCILHACARVELVKKKDKPALKDIIRRESLSVNSGRVEVTIDYLNKIKDSIFELLYTFE